MGIFFRVTRTAKEAVRQWIRMTQAESGGRTVTRGRPFHEKPTSIRRREHKDGVRRRKHHALLANLQAVYARKRRGF